MTPAGPRPPAEDFFSLVEEELTEGLSLFWDTAGSILHSSGVKLNPPAPSYFSLEANFFSALFLYSYIRADIPRNRRIYYAAANQCLRGMVTGCDNILDDEYKVTLDTDLPGTARKFRSILDIMVSDRVLTQVMHQGYEAGCFSLEQMLDSGRISLHALLKSGAQEASEENGVNRILAPDTLLSKIHALKTGILFQAPWALPGAFGEIVPPHIKEGLFLIGLGCQVMDDMVDLAMDIENKRHNYVHSLIRHGRDEEAHRLTRAMAQGEISRGDKGFLTRFPSAQKKAAAKALAQLEQGCRLLFAPEHQALTPFAVDFFARRIGADRFLEPAP